MYPSPFQTTQKVPWCIHNSAYEAWISLFYLILLWFYFALLCFYFDLSYSFLPDCTISLYRLWFLWLWGFGHIKIQVRWVVILWHQVTLKTSLSARYCTLFKVQDCWINEVMGCTNDWLWLECMGHLVPTLLYTFYPHWFYAISKF